VRRISAHADTRGELERKGWVACPLLWQRRYRLPGINNQPQDVAIDSAGNAYVAGAAWVGGGFDLVLLKYSREASCCGITRSAGPATAVIVQ
jgi:hypothetical protein